MPDLGIFDQKFFIWVFWSINFKKTIVTFEISTLQICQFVKYNGKTKMAKFGTKNAFFVYF